LFWSLCIIQFTRYQILKYQEIKCTVYKILVNLTFVHCDYESANFSSAWNSQNFYTIYCRQIKVNVTWYGILLYKNHHTLLALQNTIYYYAAHYFLLRNYSVPYIIHVVGTLLQNRWYAQRSSHPFIGIKSLLNTQVSIYKYQ